MIEARVKRYAKALRMVDEGTARPPVVEAVCLLRKGYAPQEIARMMGISRSTAYAFLGDPDRARAKALRRRLYGERVCESCGKALGEQAGPSGSSRCVSCAGKGQAKWSKETLIEAGHEYFRRYGQPPGAMDWNPSMAVNSAHPERRAELLARWHEFDWPTATTVQYHFKSWKAFMRASGFHPLKPGERRDPERWRRNRQSSRGGLMTITADDVIKREINRFEERVAQYREKLTESEQELAVLRAAQEAMLATRANGKPDSVRVNQA